MELPFIILLWSAIGAGVFMIGELLIWAITGEAACCFLKQKGDNHD
jgi:hypothetical protein